MNKRGNALLAALGISTLLGLTAVGIRTHTAKAALQNLRVQSEEDRYYLGEMAALYIHDCLKVGNNAGNCARLADAAVIPEQLEARLDWLVNDVGMSLNDHLYEERTISTIAPFLDGSYNPELPVPLSVTVNFDQGGRSSYAGYRSENASYSASPNRYCGTMKFASHTPDKLICVVEPVLPISGKYLIAGTTGDGGTNDPGEYPWVLYTDEIKSSPPIWQNISRNIAALLAPFTQTRIREVLVDPADSKRLWLQSSYAVLHNPSFLTGANWELVFGPETFTALTGIAHCNVFLGFDILQAATKASSPGALWIVVQNELPITCNGSSPKRLYVFRTTDYGQTWAYTALPNPLGTTYGGGIAICNSTNDVWVTLGYRSGFVAGYSGIYRSSDGGVTFGTPVDPTNPNFVRVAPKTAGSVAIIDAIDRGNGCDLWVTGHTELLRSQNNGVTWVNKADTVTGKYAINNGIPYQRYHAVQQYESGNANHLFTTGFLNAAPAPNALFQTLDAFETQTKLPKVPSVSAGLISYLGIASYHYSAGGLLYAARVWNTAYSAFIQFSSDEGLTIQNKVGNFWEQLCGTCTSMTSQVHPSAVGYFR